MIQNENEKVSERGSLPKSIAGRITLGCNETMAGIAFCFICGHEVNQLGFDFFVHQDDVWVRDSQVCHSCARRLRPDLTMMQREAFEFLLNRHGKNLDDIWVEIERTQAAMPWQVDKPAAAPAELGNM
jgi:hypothetical protein